MQMSRPIGVTLIAIVLYFLGGALSLLIGLVVLFFPLPSTLGTITIVAGLPLVAIGIFSVAVGWGLWQFKNWARISALVLQVLGLVFYLVAGAIFLFGVRVSSFSDIFGLGTLSLPGYGIAFWLLATLLGVATWYLLKPEVESLFVGSNFQGDRYRVGPSPLPPTDVIPPPRPPAPTPLPAPPPMQRTVFQESRVPTVGWLVVRSGSSAKQFDLRTDCRNTIGRDGQRCDFVLDDPRVSAEHAAVQWEHGQFVIHDLASRNHTFVNDVRVDRQALMDGDRIRMGDTVLVIKTVR